jgi:hypothetical protein
MKHFFSLLLIFALASCNDSNKSSSRKDFEKIIGKPIKFGNLQIAQYDFPNEMNWKVANQACAKLGNGWRLPTKDELNLIYQNKDIIGGFEKRYRYYWTSEEVGYGVPNAWLQSFEDGNQFGMAQSKKNNVRAVKSL